MTHLPDLRRLLARTLFIWAALTLGLGPSVDAVAGGAKVAVEAGYDVPVFQALAAFDVLDDTLDHIARKGAGETQQQQLAVPLPFPASFELAPFGAAGQLNWVQISAPAPPSQPSDTLERPPRA